MGVFAAEGGFWRKHQTEGGSGGRAARVWSGQHHRWHIHIVDGQKFAAKAK